jgi:hypothetical protein
MSDRSLPPDQEHRVIPFRPRGAAPWRWPTRSQSPDPGPAGDLAKYERHEGEDDYRHRMRMNALALVITVLLVVVGVWIADTIATMRKNQDCVLSGRRNCTPIEAPPTQRF